MRFTMEPCHGIPVTCNSKLPRCYIHENGNHGKAVDSRYVAHHLASLSPEQHSMIRFVRIPHIGTKRKPPTKAGSPNTYWWPRMMSSKLCLASFVAMSFIFLTLMLVLTRFPRIMEWYKDIRRTSLLSGH